MSFYKIDYNGELTSGPTVYLPDGTVLDGEHRSEVDSWCWFDTKQEALDHFGITANAALNALVTQIVEATLRDASYDTLQSQEP